jgi:hypothetical protein
MQYKATEGFTQPQLVTIRTALGSAGTAQQPGRDAPAGNKGQSADRLGLGRQEKSGSPIPQGRQHPGIKVLSSSSGGGSGKAGGSRSAFRFPASDAPARQTSRVADAAASSAEASSSEGEKEPQYTLIHRGRVELSEAWNGAGRSQPLESARPKVTGCLLLFWLLTF